MTLLDTLIDFYDALNRTLQLFGLDPISYDRFIYLFKNDRLGFEIVPRHIDPKEFWKTFRKIYESRYAKPMEGVEYLLNILKLYGAKNIIVTGREVPSLKIWNELRRFNLHHYIDKVYTMFDLILLGGIERELFDKSWLLINVLKEFGVEPEEAIMLGDYWIDALSSRNAGIPFIGITRYEERARDLYINGAIMVVKDLYEAARAISEIVK